LHCIGPNVFSEAVRDFWEIRERQANAQRLRSQSDQGSRSAVTGGRQMDGFSRKIAELPGFYRPTKEWDIVVVVEGNLLAAIELKSQIGPSFGNNFNNRTEEALGSALDIWTAYREGAFRSSPAPWLGYLLLLEDCMQSRRPVGVCEPHFQVFPEFKGASYARRYELFCRKLVRERQYSAACFFMASRERSAEIENYSEPAEDLSAGRFLAHLLSHAAGFAAGFSE
jgi:hypothetical protein